MRSASWLVACITPCSGEPPGITSPAFNTARRSSRSTVASLAPCNTHVHRQPGGYGPEGPRTPGVAPSPVPGIARVRTTAQPPDAVPLLLLPVQQQGETDAKEEDVLGHGRALLRGTHAIRLGQTRGTQVDEHKGARERRQRRTDQPAGQERREQGRPQGKLTGCQVLAEILRGELLQLRDGVDGHLLQPLGS